MFKANSQIWLYENEKNAADAAEGKMITSGKKKVSAKSKSVGRINAGSYFKAEKTKSKDKKYTYYKVTQAPTTPSSYIGTVNNKIYVGVSGATITVSDKAVKETLAAKEKENSGGQSTGADGQLTYSMDDSFAKEYSTAQQNLKDGLRVSDLRGILGMPHQFIPITDPRLDDSNNDSSFGRVYAERIIKPIPLLLLTPGTASFMTSYTNNQKKTVLEGVFSKFNLSSGELDTLVNETSGKYYSLKFAYKDYFYYVNAMLRSAAFFLGIENQKLDGTPLGQFNWLTYNGSGDSDIFGSEGLKKYLGPYAGAIPMYVDAGTSVDDSFSNNTTTSQLASSLNNLSDMGRELNFLVGNVGSMAGLQLDKMTSSENLESNIENVTSQIDGLLGKGNILSNLVSKAQTVLAGGRMIFPEIWSDSQFSRSYTFKMKLVSPSGDKFSVFLNILVPLFHLLGFVLPRQSTGQAYFSPFLCRGYCKSLFNIDMGIFTDLSITKGDEGAWTVDGLPTVAEVSFTIKDLYDGMFMSKMELAGDLSIMSNTAELDYIANTCGVNINEPATIRTIKMYYTLGFVDGVKDALSLGIFTGFTQHLNQKLQNIFGRF